MRLGLLEKSGCLSKSACNPSHEKIKAKYFEKFRGKGGEGIESEAGPSGAGPSQACASRDRPMLFAPTILDEYLPLRATPPPEDLLFSRTPSP